MAITNYTCQACQFLFERAGPVDTCPSSAIQISWESTEQEREQYRKNGTEMESPER